MNGEFARAEKLADKEAVVKVPMTETLLRSSPDGLPFPEELLADLSLRSQIEERREVAEYIDEFFDCLPAPNVPIEDCLSGGFVSEGQVAELYRYLTKLISDSDYERLILYLPFELLPPSDLEAQTENLQAASHEFADAYMRAWTRQLDIQDVQANFVDGDVLEVDLRDGDLPRVIMAAQLISGLVDRGMLSLSDIKKMAELTEDPVLKSSITDTLKAIQKHAEPEQSREAASPTSLVSAEKEARDDIQEHLSTIIGPNTERRRQWLEQQATKRAVAKFSDNVAASVLHENLSGLSWLLHEKNSLGWRIYVEGIRKAIEQAYIVQPEAAEEILSRHQTALLMAWRSDDSELKGTVAACFRHIYRLGLIQDEQLHVLGISLPELAGPTSKNLELLSNEIDELKELTGHIQKHPELSKLVYPVVMLYGSRLKGYGQEKSDIDTGIFIRPDTTHEEQAKIRQLLESLAAMDSKPHEYIEFWLQANGEALEVESSAYPDVLHADKYWTHMLFSSVWLGDEKAIAELQNALLPRYFSETGITEAGRSERALYLESIERDALLYRLLHKGYEQHYPACPSKIKSVNPKATFWDAGYRRLATQLFIKRVFLPKV